MRIISDFHDYYDSVARYDQERDVIYQRKQQEVPLTRGLEWDDRIARLPWLSNRYQGSLFAIGFCGEIHIGHNSIMEWNNRKNRYDSGKITYGMDTTVSRWTQQRFGEFLNLDWMAIFKKYNTPILAIKRNKITINPILKNYQFYKVKDTYTAWQEISMFYQKHFIEPEPIQVNLSDKDMAKKKGHDHPYSFKKTRHQRKGRKN